MFAQSLKMKEKRKNQRERERCIKYMRGIRHEGEWLTNEGEGEREMQKR